MANQHSTEEREQLLKDRLRESEQELLREIHEYKPTRSEQPTWTDVLWFSAFAAVVTAGFCLLLLWRS